jgi:hypothetical protein
MPYTVRVGVPTKEYDSETQSTVMRVPFHLYVTVRDEQGNDRLNNYETRLQNFPLTTTADELRAEAAKIQDVIAQEELVNEQTADQAVADATIAELVAEFTPNEQVINPNENEQS